MRSSTRRSAGRAALALAAAGLTVVVPHPAAAAVTAPAAIPLAHAATPQGALPTTGCTTAGTAATCELYAKPGTLTVSSIAIPIWGLSSTDTGVPGTPGPVLVVTEGATVTVNVHNGLPGALSLAVPGLLGGADDRAGAAPGATKSYTFTANRAGTYLYEAGHTPDGARQTAMGIAGAMIVRPATGPGTAYGTAFDDETALVLSEVDPALNADPAGYDLRKFQPVYRLINGKAYPETDPIATAAGRRVLLRYVNAGLSAHAMGTLGTEQSVLAKDARPSEAPYLKVSDSIAAGSTEDTLVTVPPPEDGPKFAVYETAGRLDTAGHRVGTTTTVAFGGMMTFLDTGAAPSGTDTAGPVTQKLAAAPSTATALQTVTLTADFTDVPNGGSNVTRAEFVVDDPAIAVGTGTPFTGTFGGPTVTGAQATLNLATLTPALAAGKHVVYVRALDSQGNWGVVNSVVLTVSSSGPVTSGGSLTPATGNGSAAVVVSATGDDSLLGGTVDQAEYFLGTQGANGTGSPLALNPGTVVAESATIPALTLAALPEGPVTVYAHSHDSFGLWGPAQALPFTLDRTPPAMTSGIVEPSPNNGTAGSPVDPTSIKVTAAFADPVTNGVSTAITAAEGFLDNPNGVPGTGLMFVASDGSFNATAESAYGLIPLSQLTGMTEGPHQVYVHAKDAAGNWGPYAPLTLVVDRSGPVLSAASATPNTVNRTTTGVTLAATATDNQTAVTAAEWFDGADPGKGLGHPMTVTATGPKTANAGVVAGPGGFAVGTHVLSLRARDAAGNWGATVTVTLTVTALSNIVFSDGFESGNTGAWATATGPVAVLPGSALSGTQGLQATGGGAAPAYLTDPTPLNESAYHLQFQFRPDTLATGTGTVNLAAGLSATGQQLFVVQYRKSTGAAQVRLGVRRSTGVVAYTPYLTLGTGVQTIRVDWAAGTSTTHKLTVGTASQQLTGVNTGTVRLDALWLGLSGGGAATTGAASFDAVLSTRFTLP
ncbi:multicopper oxidase domain-containing protein [Amycolatopsis sp. NBC_01480]|uniref:multicopper oxidase domain-containing protein n=1 Tax=Amycolatopsis sp. NBC_01480 TaxID=2903562 RepID=UPI002E2A62E7|nr:multicopper oxidase domain-containing protein [Amycolatopsis sp. NBC_01480]